jgi:biotin carboxyl carrier protein
VAARLLVLRDGDVEHPAVVADDGTVAVDHGQPIHASVAADGSIRLGRQPARTAWAAASGDTRWVFFEGEVYRFEVARGRPRTRGGAHHGSLSAPMPATVIRIHVAPGDRITRGQTLIVLEAMKMELPVQAPADGTIAAVCCREGELVQAGTSLIELAGEL